MKWNEQFGRDCQPGLGQIADYIDNLLWAELSFYLEQNYGVSPRVEYSCCSGAPGWNVKYKKSGRALCTLYPDEGFFTCLISIGDKAAGEAEQMLDSCTEYVRDLYWQTKPFNGSRWLMIAVNSEEILEDVKSLIFLRVKPKG